MSESDKTTQVILILDDDKSVCDLISFWLTDAGYELNVPSVLGESTLRQAMKIVPDLAIVDLQLSDFMVQGTEVISELRQAYPQMKIIAISGWPNRAQEALDKGADAFVGKPFRTYRNLLEVVEELLKSD